MMIDAVMPENLAGLRIHMVGAKGTGMAALAEVLAAHGAILSGSDVADVFYTDAILNALGVSMHVGFDAALLPADVALVVHSAAYARDANPELLEAARRGLAILNYPEALGALSRRYDSSGIAGVHGKTTTTAFAGSLASALGLPATVLAGSAVASFGGRSTMIAGDSYFIAETCEYRRHFLNFRPRRIVLTSIESDHQDFYPTFEDIYAAFLDYLRLLPKGGELIYCADDAGAARAARDIRSERPDILFTSYGETADGDYRVSDYLSDSGEARFRLAGFAGDFILRVPGRHLALDATAALALVFSIFRDAKDAEDGEVHRTADGARPSAWSPMAEDIVRARSALALFAGSKRRSEILGEAGGVLFMDDYGHHPTAVRETIRGIKEFWPSRRLVVDFMSHTYSRTKALFGEFAACLDEADALVMHGIYASAREKADPDVTGRSLFEEVKRRDVSTGRSRPLFYSETVLGGIDEVAALLEPGDLFLTMGAGDNWKLGVALKDLRASADRRSSTGARTNKDER
jgi:UDP-N-acetylmuramate--alanine ligase